MRENKQQDSNLVMKEGRPLSRKLIRPVSSLENEENAATVAEDGQVVVAELERRIVVADPDRPLGLW